MCTHSCVQVYADQSGGEDMGQGGTSSGTKYLPPSKIFHFFIDLLFICLSSIQNIPFLLTSCLSVYLPSQIFHILSLSVYLPYKISHILCLSVLSFILNISLCFIFLCLCVHLPSQRKKLKFLLFCAIKVSFT